jgi:hypothetical protein
LARGAQGGRPAPKHVEHPAARGAEKLLSEAGAVVVSFYNTLGQRVAERRLEATGTLVGGKTVGQVALDLTDLSSGVYLYVVEPAERGWKTQGKLVVVR